MPKRCLGITFDGDRIYVVQMARTREQTTLQRWFAAPLAQAKNGAALKKLLRRHRLSAHAATVSLPPGTVHFLSGPAARPAPTAEPLPEDLPTPSDQLVPAQHTTRSARRNDRSLTALVSRRTLLDRSTLIKDAGLRCERIDSAPFALWTSVAANHPALRTDTAIILYQDAQRLLMLVAENGALKTLRDIPSLPACPPSNDDAANVASTLFHEIDLAARAALGQQIPEKTTILLAGDIQNNDHLRRLLQRQFNGHVLCHDPYARILCADQPPQQAPFIIATGLALKTLTPNLTALPTFRLTNKTTATAAPLRKRQLVLPGSLAALLAVLCLAGLFVRQARLEKHAALIDAQIEHAFFQALPQETTLVKPIVQLDNCLDPLRQSYNELAQAAAPTLDPLLVLQEIAENTPAQLDIQLETLRIDPQSAQITATAPSYTALVQWQDALSRSSAFKTVQPVNQNDQHPSEQQRVRFTLQLTLNLEAS